MLLYVYTMFSLSGSLWSVEGLKWVDGLGSATGSSNLNKHVRIKLFRVQL